MSDNASRYPSRGLWIAIGVVLTPAIVVPLLVPLFDEAEPTLFGFPFYYWFQFALIPMAAVLTTIAFRISILADRRDREERARVRGAGRRPSGREGEHR